MNGIINVYKEKEMTSHDCVAIVRRVTGVKRVGHTGTLDPMATGVLPICIGRTARIMDYTDLDKKEYRCEFKLGIKTDTLDIWGEVLEENTPKEVTYEEIVDVCNSFKGEITQIPPMYSALKVNGRKLYEYAREGKEVDVKPRKVNIYELVIEKVEFPTITIRVLCSKGTYIRTLCTDIGIKLGNLATMTALERTKSGLFNVEDSVNIFDIKGMEKDQVEKLLISGDFPLKSFKEVRLNDEEANQYINGIKLNIDKIKFLEDTAKAQEKNQCGLDLENSNNIYKDRVRVYGLNMFIGVGKVTDGFLKSDKLLF